MSVQRALHTLSLTEARTAIGEGGLKPSEYAAWLLAHTQGSDMAIHAWAHLDAAYVRAQAAAADLVHRTGQGPLHGMPIGVKDIIATADQPTQYGSSAFIDKSDHRDAACVTRIAAAGGFIFGKTVTTECAYMQPGITCNPWNPMHTPGGSSSGSAAAVAARHVPAAIGSQTNGSVIRPAAFCGVVGFKPTTGVVAIDGTLVFSQTLDALGVFARTVGDAARVTSVLAGDAGIAPVAALRTRPPRIALLERFPWASPDTEAGNALDAAATRLRLAGAEVISVVLPDALDAARDVHRIVMLHEAAANLGHLLRANLSQTLAQALDQGAAIGRDEYLRAQAARLAMRASACCWMANFDAVMSPPAPGAAPASLATTGDPSFCTLWSLLGFPAIALPIGLAANRMPLGMQLASTQDSDDSLLAVAAWVEARLPFRGLT